MIGNSNNLRGLSKRARNAVPRWRTIFIALLLALTIGDGGKTLPVQAAPPYSPVKVYMEVVNPKATVCVGRSVNYVVIVYNEVAGPDAKDFNPFAESGIRVEASSFNTSILEPASLQKPNYRWTGFGSEDGVTPHSADFVFTGKKAGNTTIVFEAIAQGKYISRSVAVKVVNCKFRVSTISRWSGSSPYGSMKMVAITSRPAILDLPDTDVKSTVKTKVAWVETTRVPKYKETNDLRFGTLEVEGEIGIDGRLLLTVRLKPVTFSQKICGNRVGCGGGSVTSTPDKLELWVSSNYGGTVTHTLGVTDEGGTMFGPTTVYVIPIKK